ncbi:unnamed protein product [Sphagnum balticum]
MVNALHALIPIVPTVPSPVNFVQLAPLDILQFKVAANHVPVTALPVLLMDQALATKDHASKDLSSF